MAVGILVSKLVKLHGDNCNLLPRLKKVCVAWRSLLAARAADPWLLGNSNQE